MNKNPAIALMQIEMALNHLQNTMIGKDGKLTWDDNFFELLDKLIKELEETNKIAKSIKK